MGSTTQSIPLDPTVWAPSSPTMPSSGRASRIRRTISCSLKRSYSVTMSVAEDLVDTSLRPLRRPSVISAAQRFNVSNLPPKHRINASANWQIGDFSINARQNYFSSWANQLEYPGQTFGAKFVTDLDISYTFADRYTLTLGANNLFDTYPDKIAPTATNPVYALTNSLADGQVYPRSGGPFGINGGFYYVRVAIDY
mgnify:CR=1 FL=1